MIYDFVIIGCGISGLYGGYELLKKNINNFLILEKNDYIGGRIKTFHIDDTTVSMGAGVGRMKDINLKNMLDELGLEYKKNTTNFYYSDNIVLDNINNILYNVQNNYGDTVILSIEKIYGNDIAKDMFRLFKIPYDSSYKQCLETIKNNYQNIFNKRNKDELDEFDIFVKKVIGFYFKKIYVECMELVNNNLYKPISFKNFTIQTIGEENYKILVKNLSFTDYENEDAYLSLMYYGYEDNFESSEILYIKWDNLILKLNEKLREKIILETKLIDIEESSDSYFELVCEQIIKTDSLYKNIKKYMCKKIIFANNLEVIKNYITEDDKYKYNVVKSQPFLRVYCHIDIDHSSNFLKKLRKNGSTIVDNELCKIININREKGIFMISYCDNQNAQLLSNYNKDTYQNRKIFEKLVSDALNLEDSDIKIDHIYVFYWTLGTHYFKLNTQIDIDEMLKYLQNPFENIYVVGECLSKNQGWCEGALESVNNILKYL